MLWDVVVIGAGPAGSAVSALLAGQGHRVLMLDKQGFPRFQIGESLLPVSLPVLAELGIEPQRETHVYKRGAEFVCEQREQRRVFDFSRSLDGAPRHAYQVDRVRFDALLCERAAELGAEVRHEVEVTGVTFGETVRVSTNRGELRGRHLVDASGQGRLLARLRGSVEPYSGFGTAGAFAHYSGVARAVFDELAPHNDIRIMIARQGWGWIIPLPDQRLSVGLVTRRRGIKSDLEDYLRESPLIQRWTRGARRSDPRAVRNFSYKNTRPFGSRFACVGDAACFLDPLFSSGVSLALVSASRSAARLDLALREGREQEHDLMRPVDSEMRRAYATFAAMIDRFYHTRFIDHFLFGPEGDEATVRGVISVLAGDVFRNDNPFQHMLLGARRGKAGIEFWA